MSGAHRYLLSAMILFHASFKQFKNRFSYLKKISFDPIVHREESVQQVFEPKFLYFGLEA